MHEEKITNIEISEDQQNVSLNNDSIKEKPKLDFKVLIYVLIGIAAVFGLMMFINGLIFMNIFEQRTAYYFSILASNILFTVLIFLIKITKKITWSELGWKTVPFRSGLISTLKVWGLTWVVQIIYMSVLISSGTIPPENQLAELLQEPTFLILVINISLIAVAAPFIEETLFRGLLFGSLRPYFGTWTAIIISAAIFSGLHMELIGFVPRFALGIGLGYLFVKHDSIYPAIGLHGLNNLIAVVVISAFS